MKYVRCEKTSPKGNDRTKKLVCYEPPISPQTAQIIAFDVTGHAHARHARLAGEFFSACPEWHVRFARQIFGQFAMRVVDEGRVYLARSAEGSFSGLTVAPIDTHLVGYEALALTVLNLEIIAKL
uniref:Uncharacterized protein n=1 Tax=Romanomermis culicivorax TaxID=13658 RepID=A0A915IUM6_ROMCU